MATSGLPSVVDWARSRDPNGSAAHIAQLLSQCNQMLKDMIWQEANMPLGHKITVGVSLPQGTFRSANIGVAFSKALNAQMQYGITELVSYSGVDRSIAELWGDIQKYRYQQDMAHIEGMSQQVSGALIYANEGTSPGQMTGFAPIYNTVNGATAYNALNVIDGGGTGSSNASIWYNNWGDTTTYGIFPKGTPSGIVYEDKGDIRALYDAAGNQFEGYTSFFRIKFGLCVNDWRYNVRIANLDTTTAGLAGTSPPDLYVLLSKAMGKIPASSRRVFNADETDDPTDPKPGTMPVIYVNRTVQEYLDIQAIRDRNVLISMKDYAGEPVIGFRGIAIRVVDQLLNSEARVV
jgi:hypothetical protein